MNKIEFFRVIEGDDRQLDTCLTLGTPMVIFSFDKSMKLMLVYWHLVKEWNCTELYTGLQLATGKTKLELFERISNEVWRTFEYIKRGVEDSYWDQQHQIIADAYKQLDEARPSGLFGGHSLSQELIEYITASTFKEAIRGGKEE